MAEKVINPGRLIKEYICSATQDIEPFFIDVSSGVEKEGVKDSILKFRRLQ